MMRIVRLLALGQAVIVVALMRADQFKDYPLAFATLAVALIVAIGPLRILKFVAGLALMFLAWG